MNRSELKQKLTAALKRASPFVGLRESWKNQHGKNWKSEKAAYVAESYRQIEKLEEAIKC